MLEKITGPADLKKLTSDERVGLADEIRNKILNTVSENGGHLSSNLGIVEATIAIHTVFNAPNDKIIFDVGHQCYAHKILTGRGERFDTLRQYGGISGFPCRDESEYDVMTEGHSGTSVSAALGIAQANRLAGRKDYTVAVVGDGSLTNGMIYEALNNCTGKDLHLIIILNDNEMSISQNIGGLHEYLDRIRTSTGYFNLKHRSERFFGSIPVIGRPITAALKAVKDLIKRIFVHQNLFEDLGFAYLGPASSDNMEKLCSVLEEAKGKDKVCVVHMITRKGKGYQPAEKEPDKYHSVASFDKEKGIIKDNEKLSFSTYFGKLLCGRAEKDRDICAITAAMCDGTGLKEFSGRFPDRFFDVGIAEEHAVTFAAGLAAGGKKPVVAIYSTFIQRAYDQLMHDISVQHLPLTLVLDRSGLVAEDGITHQGIFDYPLIASIPNSEIYVPETYDELEEALDASLSSDKLSAIKIPKGRMNDCRTDTLIKGTDFDYSQGVEKADIVVITCGRLSCAVREAVGSTEDAAMIKLKKIHPLDMDAIREATAGASRIIVYEEGCEKGGYGEAIAAGIGSRVTIHAINGFVCHGELAVLDDKYGFTAEKITAELNGNSK